MKNGLLKISIIGFGLASFFELAYAINMLRKILFQGYPKVLIGVILVLFLLGALMSIVTNNLTKRKKWAYKIALILSILCLPSLFSQPDKIEIITCFSGILLFINRKTYFQKS